MIGIALLGAGIFAREQHLPAIEACEKLSLKAIYSRSQASATSLSQAAAPSPDVYFDSPASPASTLDALLARDDIHAVIVALPITSQPDVIRRALAAGKHVLSEKPVGKDVETARELIAWYAGLAAEGRPHWGVGENFRFWESLEYAAGQLREMGGEVVTFGFEMFTLMGEDNKYFQTEWRKTPEYQGGFLLDGGVHFVAATRQLLAAANQSITHLSARTSLIQPRLAPVDTVHATLTTSSGRTGTFCVSFAAEFKAGLNVEVVTTEGSVKVTPVEVITARRGAAEEKREFGRDSGVKAEVRAFAEGIGSGVLDKRLAPEEALRDLAVLQGLLESGEEGGIAKAVEG